MKPLIGITAGAIFNRDRPTEPMTYGQVYEYMHAISDAGGVPVIIPIARNNKETIEIIDRLDGILFAGGNDMSAKYYGEKNRDVEDADESRDRHEWELMRAALESHTPLLAICRGMQMLNVIRGGTLYQDITKEVPDTQNHVGYVGTTDPAFIKHTLSITKESKLAEILGTTKIKSNSRHHQAVKDVGTGLTVNAYAEDDIVEGIEDMSEGFVMGIESHPESLVMKAQSQWKPLFDAFIAAAKKS